MRFRGGTDEGAIAVVVAVFSLVAFGFAAIVVDLGYARTVKLRAQDAADSAALAGAAALFAGGGSANFSAAAAAARANANDIMGSTMAWTGCTDSARLPGPQLDCVSFDSATNPRQVRVRVPNTSVDAFLGGAVGYDGLTVSAAAVASLGPVTFTPACAICVMSEDDQVVAASAIRATQADISFNGNVQLNTGSTIRAVQRSVFLGGLPSGNTAGFQDFLVTDAAPINDPLALRPEPEPAGTGSLDPCGAGSGVYAAFELPDGCTLPAGTYVITGSLTASPGANVVGLDVQFWLQGGSVDLSQAASVILRAPSESSPLVYDRSGSPTIDLFGTTSNSIAGDINTPGGSIRGGDTCARGRIDGLIVVDELNVAPGECLVSGAPTIRATGDTLPPVLIR